MTDSISIRSTFDQDGKLAHALKYRTTSSCPTKWQLLTTRQAQWCVQCKHFLYREDGLTPSELATLIWFHEGSKPTTVYRRPDGLITTSRTAHGVTNNPGLVAGAGLTILAIIMAALSSNTARIKADAMIRKPDSALRLSGGLPANPMPISSRALAPKSPVKTAAAISTDCLPVKHGISPTSSQQLFAAGWHNFRQD